LKIGNYKNENYPTDTLKTLQINPDLNDSNCHVTYTDIEILSKNNDETNRCNDKKEVIYSEIDLLDSMSLLKASNQHQLKRNLQNIFFSNL
jgi:hypothetical protein